MDLVRNRNVMSCVRIIFWSIVEGYVIATDLQGFIPESYLSLLTLTTGGWEQSSRNLQHALLLLLPSFFLLVLGWVFFFCCCCLGVFLFTTQASWQCKPGWFSKATFSFLFFNFSQTRPKNISPISSILLAES